MSLRMKISTSAPVTAEYPSVSDEELDLEGILRKLEAPSARFVEATALFLIEWAKRGELHLSTHSADPQALQRLGFIADRLSRDQNVPAPARRNLEDFAGRLHELMNPTEFEDLGLTKLTTEARARRLKRQADEIDQRWKVWGRVDVREEFLK